VPRSLNENSPHRLRGGTNEMSTILKFLVAHKSQERLMDQSGRLQGLSRFFTAELLRRKFPQFVVNNRQQKVSGLRIATPNLIKNLRQFVHTRSWIVSDAGKSDDCAIVPSRSECRRPVGRRGLQVDGLPVRPD
jgi:hypothetical protein